MIDEMVEAAISLANDAEQGFMQNSSFALNKGLNALPLFETGAVASLGRGVYDSYEPNTRNIVSLSPNAVILVKKKAFSTLKTANDLRFFDKTEKFLLRATKALFAYKVQQIRVYESLTKNMDFYSQYNMYSLNLLSRMIEELTTLKIDPKKYNKAMDNSGFFGKFVATVEKSGADSALFEAKRDIIEILRRNAFAQDNHLTTWIVDPHSVDNYYTGPGTGVIELGLYSGFSVSTSLESSPTSGSLTLEDPYNISIITEDDIEFALQEALTGAYGLLKGLSDGSLDHLRRTAQFPPINPGELASVAIEAAGFGSADKSFDMGYIRDRLRVFYLGKPYVNVTDGIHFYINSNRSTSRFESPDNSVIDFDEFGISNVVLEAEKRLFTSGRISTEDYKNIRK